MGLLAGEVAAVLLHAVHDDRVVGPLPDAAADDVRVAVKQLVVVPDVSRAVAHRVRVLAEHDRQVQLRVLRHRRNGIHAVIHVGDHIDVVVFLLAGGVLAVAQASVVQGFQPVEHRDVIRAVSALVAGGPHDDAAVVPVAIDRALHALQMLAQPFRVGAGPLRAVAVIAVGDVREPAHEAVALDVRFQNHVEAQLVAHFEEHRGRRVVRGAHAVDVQLLHEQQVAAQLLRRLAPAAVRVGVVVVDAVELDRHAVDEQLAALRDAHGAQADALGDDLPAARELHGVQVRLLRVPEDGVIRLELRRHGVLLLRQQRAVLRVERDVRRAVRRDADDAVVPRGHADVHDVLLRALKQVAVAEDAVKPEAVLILQIAAAAPLEHPDAQRVLARMHVVRHVELGLQMAALRKADVRAVHIHERAGRDALHHEVHAPPYAVKRELALIDAAGVLVRRVGRIAGEGEVDVGVIGVFVAVQLPAGGHRDAVPAFDDLRHVDVPGEEGEAPRAVEQPVFRPALRQVVGPLGQAVFAGFRRFLVDASHKDSPLHDRIARRL